MRPGHPSPEASRPRKRARKSGPFVESWCPCLGVAGRIVAGTLARRVSETKVRLIAVPNCNVGVQHQQAVDRRQAGGRTGRSRTGWRWWQSWTWCPFLQIAAELRFVIWRNLCIPDARNNAFVCIAALDPVQCSINRKFGIPGSKRPPKLTQDSWSRSSLGASIYRLVFASTHTGFHAPPDVQIRPNGPQGTELV